MRSINFAFPKNEILSPLLIFLKAAAGKFEQEDGRWCIICRAGVGCVVLDNLKTSRMLFVSTPKCIVNNHVIVTSFRVPINTCECTKSLYVHRTPSLSG